MTLQRGHIGLVAGAGACAIALALIALDPSAALAGWLTGFAFCSAVPIGALILLMMLRLIPGAWREELGPVAESALGLLAPVALTLLPILIGMPALYRWVHSNGVYLSPWFFILRSLIFIVMLALLAWLLLQRRAWSVAVAAAGLMATVLYAHVIAVDWLMSLDPNFHSSGFGLYVLSIQMVIALAALVLMRLRNDPAEMRSNILGGLLLTVLLLSIYFAYMQYFILWSGDLPQGVAWYLQRGSGIWALAAYGWSALEAGAVLALIFPPIRHSRRALIAIAIVILIGKAIELAWLVLPAVTTDLAVAVPAAATALAGIGVLSFTSLPVLRPLLARLRPVVWEIAP